MEPPQIALYRATPYKCMEQSLSPHLGNYYCFLIPEGSSVLEIGCGSGELLQHLPNRTLAGIDLVEEQVNAAKRKLPQA